MQTKHRYVTKALRKAIVIKRQQLENLYIKKETAKYLKKRKKHINFCSGLFI